MHYDFVAIAEHEIPAAAEPVFQHLVTTYVSEANKTASVWKAVPPELLDFQPHPRANPIRKIFEHQLLSERRFFAQFVGTEEPDVADLLPTEEPAGVDDYIDHYVRFCKRRLPQLAAGDSAWWLAPRPFFGGSRERIWVFWRRVLHTCHHRTQVQSWLRMAGAKVPPIYGPSGDVKSEGDDPTYSVEAAARGA